MAKPAPGKGGSGTAGTMIKPGDGGKGAKGGKATGKDAVPPPAGTKKK
jgi:hypothetical protein